MSHETSEENNSHHKATAKHAPAIPDTVKAARLLVVDDHPIVRNGLVEMINREADLTVIGEAAGPDEALEFLSHNKPDLVLADVSLEGSSGIELVKNIKARFGPVPVLVLSMHDETLYAERALRAGAKGYIMKEESMPRLLAAIRKVLTGQIYVSEAMATRILGGMVGGQISHPETSPTQRLSDRELEIFNFIAQGTGVREIAQKLHLSVKTIETHREHIKEKLGIKSSRELLRFAVQSQMQMAD
jgi:DNA-binding NarL/FixJ family response regulator